MASGDDELMRALGPAPACRATIALGRLAAQIMPR
jgi:hypothetical protein